MIFFNYRADRIRQIVCIFAKLRDNNGNIPPIAEEVEIPENIAITSMSRYKPDWDSIPVIFPPQHMGNVLAEWLSKQKIPQCHIAETVPHLVNWANSRKNMLMLPS